MFKPGISGNPNGRPPVAIHLVFAKEMMSRGYDIANAIAEALKKEDWEKVSKFKDFMPYCFVILRAKEFDIKPDSPEKSKTTVDERIEAAKEFALAKSGNSNDKSS
jgi:hypothetical protein